MTVFSQHFPYVLGTVQLGMPYGIQGVPQPSKEDAILIVDRAWKHQIREFDTAQDYADSEKILGLAIDALEINDQALVSSKLSSNGNDSHQAIEMSLDKSLSLLRIPRLHCLMLHNESMLDLWSSSFSKSFKIFKQQGKIRFSGVSVYSPQRALQALETDGIDIIQLPTNIFDQRFEKTGIFKKAEQLSKQIYIRSIFLQGLLLMKVEDIPIRMAYSIPEIVKLDKICNEIGLSRSELVIGYLKHAFPNVKLLFGVDSPDQVVSNTSIYNAVTFTDELFELVKNTFQDVDVNIINPTLWPH
ncbi:MAG: aldo/keto reductase [Pseudomonadota bacterium]